MRRALLSIVMIAMFVITSGAVAAQTPASTPEATPSDANVAKWECGRLESYHQEVFAILLAVDGAQDVSDVINNTGDFAAIRPSKARSASLGADEWATSLEKMDDIPLAAVEYHRALINSLSTLSGMLLSYANNGVGATLPYSGSVSKVNAALDAASYLGSSRCPVEWRKAFGESSSTPTP